jgi:hypothetical protein
MKRRQFITFCRQHARLRNKTLLFLPPAPERIRRRAVFTNLKNLIFNHHPAPETAQSRRK